MDRQKEDAWQEAKRLCRLSDEELTMAEELGFQPNTLIKNIPSRSQRWKLAVNKWVRALYEQEFGPWEPTAASREGEERRNADAPWPDNQGIADLPPLDLDLEVPADEFADDEFFDRANRDRLKRPDENGIAEQNILMPRRQRLLRWAAEAIALAH